MDFSKHTLKELIKIVRLNKKTHEVCQFLDLKDIKFSKKRPLATYMNEHNTDFTILEGDIETEVKQEQVTPIEPNDDEYQDSPVRLEDEVNESEKNFIQINYDDIKKKTKPKPKPKIIYESPEEIEHKNSCLSLIDKYFERFNWLQDEGIDLSDPVRALKIIENKVSCRNTSELVSQNFFALCGGIESLAVDTPQINNYFKIQGFTNNLRANQAAQDCLDEIVIKYTPSIIGEGGLPVEARFGLIILGCLYQTHQINSLSEQVKDIKNKPIPATRKFEL